MFNIFHQLPIITQLNFIKNCVVLGKEIYMNQPSFEAET